MTEFKSWSETSITPEHLWISKFSNWDLDDDVPGPSASAPQTPPVLTETVEESEEEEESGEDDDEYKPEA